MIKQYNNYKKFSQTEIELLHIEASDQHYPVHFHKKYCLGEVLSGSLKLEFENETRTFESGDIFLIPPFKTHSCFIDKDENVSYRIFSFSGISELLSLASENKLAHNILTSTNNRISKDLINDTSFKHQYSDFTNAVTSFLDKECSTLIEAESLSEIFQLSKSRIQHLFKKETGISISRYIMLERIRKSKELLLKMKCADVALECGFYDQSQFCRYFKKYTGISPQKYTESINKSKKHVS